MSAVADEREIENERLAIKRGWKWMAWHGIPVKGTPNYPQKQMVRCFMSPKAQKYMRTSAEWKRHWQKNGDTFREAIGDEPLEYGYCSSQGGPEVVPDFVAIDAREMLVHRVLALANDIAGANEAASTIEGRLQAARTLRDAADAIMGRAPSP